MLQFVPENAHDLITFLLLILVRGIAVESIEDAGLLPLVILPKPTD